MGYAPLFGPKDESVRNIDEAKRKFTCVNATVLGDVSLEHHRAGLIEDSFFGESSKKI